MSGKIDPKIPVAPACPSITILFKKIFGYFNIYFLIKAFFIAFCFTLFIYLDYFDIKLPILDTFFGLLSFFFILRTKRVFLIGFFIGILWFYWIALSFRYYDLTWMIPFIILFVGLVYGSIFAIGYWSISILVKKISVNRPIYQYTITLLRALFIWIISYIHPFGFNWFIPELIFINSYLNFDKFSFFLILLSLSLIKYKNIPIFLLALFLLFFSIKTDIKKPNFAPLKIYLSQTKIPQDKKWNPIFEKKIVDMNFYIIDNAIKKGYDLVVLPESAFPLFLNKRENILNRLKKKSLSISIVTGALYLKDKKAYNSSYIFSNGKYIVANKVVLVPFGEEIPLPKPISKWINRVFFNSSSDYSKAEKPTDFYIKNVKFRNAICYEATHPLLYKNSPKYMIAISNNAWFSPSIEPTLQNLIIKYFARLNNIIVYHSTNIAKTDVIW